MLNKLILNQFIKKKLSKYLEDVVLNLSGYAKSFEKDKVREKDKSKEKGKVYAGGEKRTTGLNTRDTRDRLARKKLNIINPLYN